MSTETELHAAFGRLQEELKASHGTLQPLADHVQSSYAASRTSEQRAEAFQTARSYVTQALASVAYQVNEGASLLEQMMALQQTQLDDLNAKLLLPRQQVSLHVEHLGRRSIAALTTPRKNLRTRKVNKVQADPQPSLYVRKPLSFDALDQVGHGIAEPEDPQGKVQALHKFNERRYSNAPTPGPVSAPRGRPGAAAADNIVEDIYGSLAPLKVAPGGLAKVKIAMPVVAARTTPSAPSAPSAPAPPPPPPPPPAQPITAAAQDHLYESPGPALLNRTSSFVAPSRPISKPPAFPPPSIPTPAAEEPAPAALPPPPPPPAVQAVTTAQPSRAVALYDYQATQPDELTFFENEMIEILARNGDGWFEGMIGPDRRGLFPGNYVQELNESES